MKRKLKPMRKSVFMCCKRLALGILMAAILIFGLPNSFWAQTIKLQKPKISGASFLDNEAGITAYMNAGQAIDLSLAKKAFRTIEDETDTYIIGSDSLPGYPETEDVHVYVNKDGWIVAYYLKQEPTAKIIDTDDYCQSKTIRRTKLEVAITQIANKAFISLGEINYYHFVYPNANRLMIIIDVIPEDEKENAFDIKLPSGLTYYERSYMHFVNQELEYSMIGGSGFYDTSMYIDDQSISSYQCDKKKWNYGILTPAQLSIDQYHQVKIELGRTAPYYNTVIFGSIVIVYSEP